MLLDPECNDPLFAPTVLETGGLRALQKRLMQSREPYFEQQVREGLIQLLFQFRWPAAQLEIDSLRP